MQKVFEKIKKRLEKERKEITKWDSDKHYIYIEGADWMGAKSIEIVDQVAKEFAADINVGRKTKYIQSSEKVCDLVDKIFSHNEIVALWKEEKDEISYHKLLWRGMAWDIPSEYKNCKFVKIFGTIPESIVEADTINVEVEYD